MTLAGDGPVMPLGHHLGSETVKQSCSGRNTDKPQPET